MRKISEKQIKDECKVMWQESKNSNGKERLRMSQKDKEKALLRLKKKLKIILKLFLQEIFWKLIRISIVFFRLIFL
jgi:hypothetical protein